MGSSVDLSSIGQKLTREEAQFHRETVADLLGRHSTHFPGAQPVSFARRHFAELQHADYYMCEKTDGMRCLLYLHRFYPDEIEAQFLIDRKNDYYYLARDSMHLPLEDDLSAFHTGTILDGELVRQHYPDGHETLMYMIFDCLCLDGQNVMSRPYEIRLGKVRKFVYDPWRDFARRYPDDAAAQPFQLKLKKMETSYGAEMMFRDVIPQLPHGNDGLIFTCRSTPYVAGTDPHILKWKPPEENTIDFRIRLGDFPLAEDEDGQYEDFDAKPEISLLVNNSSNDDKLFANLTLTDAEWETFKSLGQMIDGRIIECYRDAATGAWRPKLEHHDQTPRFRDDKKEANHYTVVESVLGSIEDAVSEADLIAHAPRIKEAWKERERAAAKRREEEKRKAMELAEREKRRKAEAATAAKAKGVQQTQAERPKHEEVEDTGPRYSD